MNAESWKNEAMIASAVREAWIETLPGTAFDTGLSWGDAGGDSLQSQHLALRLESRLGRRISVDLITLDITPTTLAGRIMGRVTAGRFDAPVFLVPGFLGDEGSIGGLRRALEHRIAFELLGLPDLDSGASTLCDLEQTGRFVADRIEQRQPQGPIMLAGYSFGACAAWQVALELMSRGRTLALVGLIDPWTDERLRAQAPHAGARAAARARSIRTWLGRDSETVADAVHWLAFLALFHLGAREWARALARIRASPRKAKAFLRRRNHFLRWGRYRALRRWRMRSLEAPTLLMVSDEQVEHGILPRWRALCPAAQLVRLPGRHREVFERDALARMVPIFDEAVTTAREAARPGRSDVGRGEGASL